MAGYVVAKLVTALSFFLVTTFYLCKEGYEMSHGYLFVSCLLAGLLKKVICKEIWTELGYGSFYKQLTFDITPDVDLDPEVLLNFVRKGLIWHCIAYFHR